VLGGGRTTPLQRTLARREQLVQPPPLGPYYLTLVKNSSHDGKEKRGTKHLMSWRATRQSFRLALTYSCHGGGTDAVQSASLNGLSLSSGFPSGMVVPSLQGMDSDPPEETCHKVKPRNYHEMSTNTTRNVSDLLLRFVGSIPSFICWIHSLLRWNKVSASLTMFNTRHIMPTVYTCPSCGSKDRNKLEIADCNNSWVDSMRH
jgi:hypothetical protein